MAASAHRICEYSLRPKHTSGKVYLATELRHADFLPSVPFASLQPPDTTVPCMLFINVTQIRLIPVLETYLLRAQFAKEHSGTQLVLVSNPLT
jgi:hypothetical protein